MSNLFDNIQEIKNPVIYCVWMFFYCLLAIFNCLYKMSLMFSKSFVIPIINTFLSFFFLRIVVGESQSGRTWEHHYMLSYNIRPWERFTCQDNRYKSLFRVSYI